MDKICLVDVRGEMGRLVRDDRKATVIQITTRYHQGYAENTISEAQHSNTEADGYSSRRPHQVSLLSAKNMKTEGYNLHRLTKIGQ